MKEISKAEFIRKITNGKSLFIGISPATDDSEINAVRQRRLERHSSHARECKAMSNQHLVFDNNSHLYLADVKPHTFIKCYEEDGILIVEQKYISQFYGFEDEITYKYLYYAMV